jgi:hypothetical protein
MKRSIVVLAAGLLCISCVGEADISGDRRNVGSVSVIFKVEPARVRVGQAVRLTFRLVNNAGREERLTFPSAQRYDFWVTSGTRQTWRWSKGQVFVQALTNETISAQGSLTLGEAWTPEHAGSYVAHGRLTARGYERELTGRVVVE